jgi:phage tail protein X
MRLAWIGLAAVVLSAGAAFANVAPCATSIPTGTSTETGGPDIPVVPRGEMLAVACDSIRASGAEVSVVMTIMDQASDATPGLGAVLATEQRVLAHSVSVQVPDLPDLANHTVHVRVYVTDASGTRSCDAGNVRIV